MNREVIDATGPENPDQSLLPGESFAGRMQRRIFGERRDVSDPHALHKISLIAFLAWVGLGADGLSSSAYGPEEAFRALGEHHYLALALAVATAVTVLILSASYSSIIEQFPGGGGTSWPRSFSDRGWGWSPDAHSVGAPNTGPLDRNAPTAVVLVSTFSGLGVHTILSALRFFPGLYRQFIFVSIAVVDSGHFKGREEIEALT